MTTRHTAIGHTGIIIKAAFSRYDSYLNTMQTT
jgi:hypothetical protein